VQAQVEVENAEAYMYDGGCLAKAEEFGKPGLVTIVERQVGPPRNDYSAHHIHPNSAQTPNPKP
jgi:hypothetical protein